MCKIVSVRVYGIYVCIYMDMSVEYYEKDS